MTCFLSMGRRPLQSMGPARRIIFWEHGILAGIRLDSESFAAPLFGKKERGGGHPFAYGLFGAPVVGKEVAGGRSSVYRFHLDSPIPFTKSLRATIEHGHANHRSDNYFSVAYWYQAEPHAAFRRCRV